MSTLLPELIIRFNSQRELGRFALEILSPDGSQVKRPLILDSAPKYLSGDLVLSAGLIYSGYSPEKLIVEWPVTEHFAEEINSGFGCEVIAAKARPDLNSVSRPKATILEVSTGVDLDSKTPDREITRLLLVPNERFSGSLIGVKEVVIAGNAEWMASLYGAGALIAAGILFSTDFMAHSLSFPYAEIDDAEYEFARKVCRLNDLQFLSKDA